VKIAPTITMITVCSLAATVSVGFSSGEQIPSADQPEAAAPLGPQNNHEGLTWPPQPRGITDVVLYSDVEKEKKDHDKEKVRLDRLEGKAKAKPEAKQALGKKFTRITVIDKEDKETGTVGSQLVFFSREDNATVEVEFDKDEEIKAVQSIPARDYQPEITNEEAEEAAALARTYFLNLGFAKVTGLKPYGILAYKPEGVGFFDTRVLYISFHQHDDAPPELAAWVDLTNQLILQAREEQ